MTKHPTHVTLSEGTLSEVEANVTLSGVEGGVEVIVSLSARLSDGQLVEANVRLSDVLLSGVEGGVEAQNLKFK